MNKSLQIFGICFLAVGLIFGRYIGRWLINVFDNPDTSMNDGYSNLASYLSKCDTITLNMKDFKESRSFFEVKAKFNPSSSDNTAFAYKHEIKFYSDALHKYFSIFYFFSNAGLHQTFGMYLTRSFEDSGEDIIATVNKIDFADVYYGTKEKPIPIVYFEPKVKESYSFYSLVKGNKKGDFNGSEADFKKYMLNSNASYYLSYVKILKKCLVKKRKLIRDGFIWFTIGMKLCVNFNYLLKIMRVNVLECILQNC